MRLSDQPEYLEALPAIADGDYETGRKLIGALVARCGPDDLQHRIFLVGMLGNIEALAGNVDKGHALHSEAIALDPRNPLALVHYAKSLARDFGDPIAATNTVADVERIVTSGDWQPASEDDLGRDWYLSECAAVRASLSG